MENLIDKIYNDKDFILIVSDIINNETVQKMKNYRQHCATSCFDHCLVASYLCYKICKKHGLDYTSCARAAMIHDLFLYDWRKKSAEHKGLHAFTHPKTAYLNAKKLFNLNEKEQDIILKHMWPVTLSIPKYKESFVLTFVDKRCALSETFSYMQSLFLNNKVFRYAYIFLTVILFRFY